MILEVQRPQKMVRIHFEDRDTLICVRPCLGGVGKASLATPQSEKRLQADVPEARLVKTARKAAAKAKAWILDAKAWNPDTDCMMW